MSASDDLNKAADVLERDGWIQRNFHRDGSYCALGAIDIVTKSDTTDSRAVQAADALREFACPNMPISWWNDKPERTKDEVIQAMRDCATKNQPDQARQVPGGGGACRDSMWG